MTMEPDSRSSQVLTRMLLRVREEFARMKVDAEDLHATGKTPDEKVTTAPLLMNQPAVAAEITPATPASTK